MLWHSKHYISDIMWCFWLCIISTWSHGSKVLIRKPKFGQTKGSAETLVRRSGITNHRLVAYSLSNISAENYQNRLMCIEVIVYNISVVFLRHSVVLPIPLPFLVQLCLCKLLTCGHQICIACESDMSTPTGRFAFGLTYFLRSLRLKYKHQILGQLGGTDRKRCT